MDPVNSAHIVGVWQQDRWLNGAASGLLAAVSFDQGRTWTRSSAPFSRCSGGAYDRASDPWVAISPDRTVYQSTLATNDSNMTTAVMVSRSPDGGASWGDPVTLIVDPADSPYGDDKESITADPGDTRYVYAVWDRQIGNSTIDYFRTAWFSRTADGGSNWEPARKIFDPGVNTAATANQIMVLPDGSLLDIFIHTINAESVTPSSRLAYVRSLDHGITWSPAQTIISTDETIGVVDVKTGFGVRTGAGIPSMAVDRRTGAIYLAWQDGRFSGHERDGIAFARSLDGGRSWSPPIQVNQAPGVQAFTPSIAVNTDGRIGVTYYDFRKDTPDPGTLLTCLWRVVSTDGGDTWREARVTGPFDLLNAPRSGVRAPFLGDYQGLAAVRGSFLAFFSATNSGEALYTSSIFVSSAIHPGDTFSNGRVEINHSPHPFRPEPSRGRKPGETHEPARH